MADTTPIYKAINACLTASPAPPTSGDLAAAVIRAVADQVVPAEVSFRRGMRPGGTGSITPDEFMQDQRQATRRKLLVLATALKGTDV